MLDVLTYIGAIIAACLWLWTFVYVVRHNHITSGARVGYVALMILFPGASLIPVWILVALGVGFKYRLEHVDRFDE
jgi:hypothetical protein